jgi:hypothetical protein
VAVAAYLIDTNETNNNVVNEKQDDVATASNDWGCTAAHFVAMSRSTDVDQVRRLCELLQERKVSFCQTQKQGHSPLHKAAQYLNRPVMEWMLAAAGWTAEEIREIVSKRDEGGHSAIDIWRGAGGEESFAQEMEGKLKATTETLETKH